MALNQSFLAQMLARQLHASPACFAALRLCQSEFGGVQAAVGRFLSTSAPLHQEAQASTASTSSQTATNSNQSGESTSQQQQSSSASSSAEGVKQKVSGAFHSGYERVKSSFGSGGGGHGVGSMSAMTSMYKEVQDVFKPADNIRSATRMYTGPVMEFAEGDSTATALQLVQKKQTAWDTIRQKLSGLPFFNKLRSFRVEETAAYKKGQEVVEDLKEKYETSDHPMVHKIDEVKERVLTGSDTSRAMLEIRSRDPFFDTNKFVRALKLDAPVVVGALLRRDMDTLNLHLSPEMMERCAGIFKHEAERGYEDPHILFVSDVELVETRLMDGEPFIIAQFHCQQLKCVRDKFGNVVEGAPDSIQRVYYFWGLQQEKTGVVTADGEVLPPRWVIKDMMWQSMLALV